MGKRTLKLVLEEETGNGLGGCRIVSSVEKIIPLEEENSPWVPQMTPLKFTCLVVDLGCDLDRQIKESNVTDDLRETERTKQ